MFDGRWSRPPQGSSISVSFTIHPKGLTSEATHHETAELSNSGLVIQWLRIRLRRYHPVLAEADQKTAQDWLGDTLEGVKARSRIREGKLYEYVIGQDQICIRLSAQQDKPRS